MNLIFYLLIILIIQSYIRTALCLIKIYTKDSDVNKDIINIIESRGFRAETHYVTTEDGYILTIHRIINPLIRSGRPVICQHGIQSSSIDWIINSPGIGTQNSETFYKNQKVSNNMGFALSMFGYDVWLTNSRGNYFGANHTKLNPNGTLMSLSRRVITEFSFAERKFWEFSTDEMITFDLPAVIKYILTITKRSSLGYIGFSQGTRIMFGLLSERPEYAKIVKPFIALAPVARVDNVATPFRFMARAPIPEIGRSIGGPFLLSPGITNTLGKVWCRVNQIEDGICSSIIYLIFGCGSEYLNKTRVHVYMSHTPAGCSMWTFVQYLQNLNSKSVAKFDYGSAINLQKYKSIKPPAYDFRKIRSKNIALMSALNDLLADPLDVQLLRNQLRDKLLLDYIIPDNRWDHISFLWGKEAAKHVNFHALRVLEMFRNHH